MRKKMKFSNRVNLQVVKQHVQKKRIFLIKNEHVIIFSFTNFQNVYFQCLTHSALVAFVWLFSTVCFEVCLQRACLRGAKVTLVAFVWFFFNVYFQKCPQMAHMRGCIVTLIAFVWLYDFYILHPLNQPYYFEEFVPLPLSDMIFVTSNACIKLSALW